MTQPPPLPPVPTKSRAWIVFVVLFVVVFFVAIGVSGFMIIRKTVAKRDAMARIENIVADEKRKMADRLASGETTDGDAAIGRMKAQFEKSATDMDSGDADAMRAMAGFMGKVQQQVRDYETALEKLTTLETFRFKIREKTALEEHRLSVRDFLAKNTRLTETMRNGGALMRAELVSAGVPEKKREAAIRGYLRSQAISLPLQMRIRGSDQQLGDAALAILDHLEKNWGKWHYDEPSDGLIFDDDPLLEWHNAHIEKIQAAAADQEAAQAELVKVMRAK